MPIKTAAATSAERVTMPFDETGVVDRCFITSNVSKHNRHVKRGNGTFFIFIFYLNLQISPRCERRRNNANQRAKSNHHKQHHP